MSDQNQTEQDVTTVNIADGIISIYDEQAIDTSSRWEHDSGETREQIEQFEYNHAVEAVEADEDAPVVIGVDLAEGADFSVSAIVTVKDGAITKIHEIKNVEEIDEEVAEIEFDLIVGTTLDGWIGDAEGKLPFSQSADLQNFKRLTTGQCIIMGRKTLESIGSLLPNRLNVIITHQPLQVDAWLNAGDTDRIETRRDGEQLPLIVSSFAELKRRLPEHLGESQKAYIIGGDSIYQQALNELNVVRISRTVIHTTLPQATVEAGWARFDMPSTHMVVSERGRFEADAKNQYPYTFEDYTLRTNVAKHR
jgi:dihydrofolate reductase